MKLNYEALIKEAKNVINESEKQYNLLAKEIEAEKLNKVRILKNFRNAKIKM
jgi:hypothetical protein